MADRTRPPPPPLQLTDRDLEILRALNRYRYLRTSQIRRLLFASASLQATRRRLQKLSHPTYRYLGKIAGAAQVAADHAETAYYLERGGASLLSIYEEKIVPYPRSHPGRVGHMFLEHALALSEFRLTLELALAGHQHAELKRFVSEHELKEGGPHRHTKQAFRLFHQFPHPHRPAPYVVFPDGLFILSGLGRLIGRQRLYVVEIDRGSESLGVIRDKVIGYRLFAAAGTYRKFGDFPDFRLLIQATGERRAKNIRAALTGLQGEELAWVTAAPLVTPASVLSEPIWTDHENKPQRLLRLSTKGADSPATS